MMYIFENEGNEASIVYSAKGLTQEQIESSIAVNELPANPYKNGVLKAKKETGEIWWEEAPQSKILSKAEFFKLLTWEEQLKIRNYQNYITEQDKLEAFTVLYENFKDFKEVDLSDANWVQDFAQIVIWCEILTAERIAEIIGA